MCFLCWGRGASYSDSPPPEILNHLFFLNLDSINEACWDKGVCTWWEKKGFHTWLHDPSLPHAWECGLQNLE